MLLMLGVRSLLMLQKDVLSSSKIAVSMTLREYHYGKKQGQAVTIFVCSLLALSQVSPSNIIYNKNLFHYCTKIR